MYPLQLLATGLDPQPALDALARHPALWDVMTERQDFPGSPHAATRCIVVRGPTELTPEAAFNEIPAVPYMPAFQLLSGAIAPLIKLNRLLLPAPFGPMIAVIFPRWASRLTSLTACSAPKRTPKPCTLSIGCISALPCCGRPACVVVAA